MILRRSWTAQHARHPECNGNGCEECSFEGSLCCWCGERRSWHPDEGEACPNEARARLLAYDERMAAEPLDDCEPVGDEAAP